VHSQVIDTWINFYEIRIFYAVYCYMFYGKLDFCEKVIAQQVTFTLDSIQIIHRR